MSSYQIRIVCPHCGEQDGMAIDDFFGNHRYGMKCNNCKRVYKSDQCIETKVVEVLKNAEWERRTVEKGGGSE